MQAICLLGAVLSTYVGLSASSDAPTPYFPFATSEFSTCAENGTLRELRLAAIREEILAKLRLRSPPTNPRRFPKINKSTLSAYHAASQIAQQRATNKCGRDTFYAKQISLFFPIRYQPVIPPAEMFEWGPLDGVAKRAIDVSVFQNYIPPTSYKLVFKPELDSHNDELIWSADLRLFKKKKVFDDPRTVKQERGPDMYENIEIYYVSYTRGADGKDEPNYALISSKDVDVHTEGYESFDVTTAIRNWITEVDTSGILELEVVVKCPQSVSSGLSFLPSLEFVLGEGEKMNHTAQLVVATLMEDEMLETNTHTGQGRLKRQNMIDNDFCLAHPEESNCCLRRLDIDFRRDLGWFWILAPRRFRPNYCQGLCPFFWPTASTSTFLLTRYSDLNPTAAVQPCCVAASLRPLTVLMVVNGRIFLEELSGMIVESCICR